MPYSLPEQKPTLHDLNEECEHTQAAGNAIAKYADTDGKQIQLTLEGRFLFSYVNGRAHLHHLTKCSLR